MIPPWLTLESLWPTPFVSVLVVLALVWALGVLWSEHRTLQGQMRDTAERRRLMLRYEQRQQERRGER